MSSDDSSSEQSQGESRKKMRKIPLMQPILKYKPKHKQIVINLSLTRYDVIADVAYELQWRIQYSKKKGDWDVLWTDHMISPQTLIKMHFFQKISHFGGIHVLARKNLLGLSFMEMSKRFPEEYNFFPKTWMLPNDYPDFRKQVEKNESKCFIVKPEADCQGRGIFLTFKTDNVQNGKHYVVQEYIERPFLVEGLKFDFRVYVLLAGTNPMRLFVYGQGLARLATEKYSVPNKQNIKKKCMHLTNYAVNKKNPKYIYNKSAKNMGYGHKRSLTSVFKYIERRGLNINLLKEKINDTIVKTFIVGQPLVSHQYKFAQPDDEYRQMCFHILGIDIMIDEFLNPVIIEVNHTPSFATDTPLDYHIKFNLIKDTLVLLNINQQTKKGLINKTNSYNRQRVTNAKRLIETEEQKEKVKDAQEKRNQYENRNLGNYTRIYPVQDEQKMKTYAQLLRIADKLYFSDGNFIRSQIEEAEQSQLKETQMKESTKSPKRKKNNLSVPLTQESFSKEQKKEKLEDSTTEIKRKEMMMSSLLHNPPNTPLTSFTSSFPKKDSKPNFGANKYLKLAKSINELSSEQLKKDLLQPFSQLKFPTNLPKIQSRLKYPIRSSTIEIQKSKYISLSKKKNIEQKVVKGKQEEEQLEAELQEKKEQKKEGLFLVPKILRFHNSEKGQKKYINNFSFGTRFGF